jgi:MSHA biogenesis protein MshJ
MKQQWNRLQQRIDAMSLRERALAFGVAAMTLITVINTFALDPLLSKQKALSEQIRLEQQQIAAMQAEISIRVMGNQQDPDAATRERLQALRQDAAKMREQLLSMQKGLVSPDKMASLLEDLLRQNGRLQLRSLRTLPVTQVEDGESAKNSANSAQPAAAPAPATAPAKPNTPVPLETLYRHGVEIVVQGTYPDLANYLAQLERMPWQLFWASASLNVETYPKATLKLNLFTLSLDKSWLNI